MDEDDWGSVFGSREVVVHRSARQLNEVARSLNACACIQVAPFGTTHKRERSKHSPDEE
jgi:hypothetical protein